MSEQNNCTIPPIGWRCTRAAGHDGPCAAIPLTMEEATLPHRNALAMKSLCQLTQRIVASLYGTAMGMDQVKEEVKKLDEIQTFLVGKTTSQPPSGSPSITSSPQSSHPPSVACAEEKDNYPGVPGCPKCSGIGWRNLPDGEAMQCDCIFIDPPEVPLSKRLGLDPMASRKPLTAEEWEDVFSEMQNSVAMAGLNLPNVGEYIAQLDAQIGNLKRTIENARGWIMANTCVPAHNILKTLNAHMEDQPNNPSPATAAQLMNWIDSFVTGDNSLEILEEDGGIIVIARSHQVQNSYVAPTMREALCDAMHHEG